MRQVLCKGTTVNYPFSGLQVSRSDIRLWKAFHTALFWKHTWHWGVVVHGGDRILAVFTSSCAINVYLTRRVGSLSGLQVSRSDIRLWKAFHTALFWKHTWPPPLLNCDIWKTKIIDGCSFTKNMAHVFKYFCEYNTYSASIIVYLFIVS
jgi:hypothetical protein